MRAATGDEIAGRLLAHGLIGGAGELDRSFVLRVPDGFVLPAPWGLPSRLFSAPISVSGFDGSAPRELRLRHPLLLDHPFVWEANL
jgi:hypothetical protein